MSKNKYDSQGKLLRLVFLSMTVAIGVVISPILRIEGMCPTAHLVNIVCAVLLGPWYALANALITAFLRMTLMAIPPLAITGSVFGAVLSGVMYRVTKGSILAAVLGEIVGTGIIGALVSYPVMAILMGREGLTAFFYVPLFLGATIMGGVVAYILLTMLKKMGALTEFQIKLGSK